MSKITEPKTTGVPSVEIRTVASEASVTPVSPLEPTPLDSRAILQPPRGPDGKPYVLEDTGSTWRPIETQPKYSIDDINNLTNNGLDTEKVIDYGLDALIAEKTGAPVGIEPSIPSLLDPNTELTVPGAFTRDTKLMGQQLWKYPITLYNHRMEPYELPARAVVQLCIEDDLLSWPLRGYVIIDNRSEGFERSLDINSAHFFRTDARDEIHIKLWPEVEQGVLPDKIWKIDLQAVIYDIEDLPHTDLASKLKKVYFWDKKFQYLLEKNIQWSTSTGKRYVSAPCPAPISQATDYDRSMFTGEAIASILAEAGYESYIDLTRWDWGKTKILFTAKADQTIWDCIQYILDLHLSVENNDNCLLEWDRGDKVWTLLPVWKIFEQSTKNRYEPGDLQIEHMFIEEPVGDSLEDIVPNKAPLDLDVSYVRDIKSDDFNRITNYRFSQTSGLDNAKAFLTTPVYSHWHKKKQFDTDAKENEISYVKNMYFAKNYVERLFSADKYPVMSMNRTKTEQKTVEPLFSPVSTIEPVNDRRTRSTQGRGKILYTGLFLNQNLSIRVIGSTHRLAGTFIGVDRVRTSSDTLYDYQLCGQYFVTNVKHIIQHQKYVNDIVMVKVHAHKSLPVNEGVE